MTRMCQNVPLQNQSDSWIKASIVIAAITAAVLTTMVLAGSHSAPAQAKTYRSEGFELRALERNQRSGTLSAYQVLL